MNKDQVKGKMKDIAGKAQEKVGKVTGRPEDRVAGIEKQVEGKMQKGVGDVKQRIEDNKDNPGSDKE
jgi:uncharacterized protein YjbJ (UPF0337 family)